MLPSYHQAHVILHGALNIMVPFAGNILDNDKITQKIYIYDDYCLFTDEIKQFSCSQLYNFMLSLNLVTMVPARWYYTTVHSSLEKLAGWS